ncbi:MAG: ubiquinol-cytochrome c reductase iron-sulfur subunit [Deltaproteobacteria bacterium]|nr:ubiquinol-cytochrome c reductase iron-sulfur subunit [Deltaproteobacteria bacterium]
MQIDRRDFLKYSIWGLGLLAGASLFVPGAGYFLSPAWKEMTEDWILLGDADKIPVGEPTKLEFVQRRKDGWMTVEKKRSAWILTQDGKSFTAFDPHCTHLGCPYRWDVSKQEFLCPCHNAVFGINGNVISGPPPRPLDRYATRMEDGKLWLLPVLEKEKT